MNMLDLPCVSISAGTAKRHNITNKSELPAPRTSINDLVVALSVIRPLWTFSIKDDGGLRNYGFEVHQSGEKLGEVAWGYFRSNYGFIIKNERIAKDRTRGSNYRTSDTKKALAMIKKTFYRQNFTERFANAATTIDRLLSSEIYEKRSKAAKARGEMNEQATLFAYAFHNEFKDFLKSKNRHNIWETHTVANLEMRTIEDAKKAHDSANTAIVLRADGQYIVKLRDKVEIMDDTTLPPWLKAKLGMLKLVENDHFVSDVGCRVNAECFMVLTKDEEDQI
jgi:hypothetical protein